MGSVVRISQTENVVLFQTPVPNYKDVDLSFSYENFHSTFDFAKMEQTSPYDIIKISIPTMSKIIEHQLNSPHLQEFIRLAKLCILVSDACMP
jgi:hypothetical protein